MSENNEEKLHLIDIIGLLLGIAFLGFLVWSLPDFLEDSRLERYEVDITFLKIPVAGIGLGEKHIAKVENNSAYQGLFHRYQYVHLLHIPVISLDSEYEQCYYSQCEDGVCSFNGSCSRVDTEALEAIEESSGSLIFEGNVWIKLLDNILYWLLYMLMLCVLISLIGMLVELITGKQLIDIEDAKEP